MANPAVVSHVIKKISNSGWGSATDLLAVEEPLEIRLGYGPRDLREQKSISVTMRTPGSDFELALGFLYTEGIIQNYNEVLSIRYCSDSNKQESKNNIVRVELKEHLEPNLTKLQRNFYTSSSCGVCGKTSLESIRTVAQKQTPSSTYTITIQQVLSLPARLRERQAVFQHTGGLHACALFDASAELLVMYEDIGRHNALDKLIGAVLLDGKLSFENKILLLSGRASFELIQKAVMAGVGIVCAVGAPSSLAVTLANEFGITLIGFLREERFNMYCHEHRIKL
jgi:FdhD protein